MFPDMSFRSACSNHTIVFPLHGGILGPFQQEREIRVLLEDEHQLLHYTKANQMVTAICKLFQLQTIYYSLYYSNNLHHLTHFF